MRWITLEGAANVRDVGGLPTADGSVTAEHRLLRADNLQNLTPDDVSVLIDRFGLTRVVDLRSVAELTAEGPGPLKTLTDPVEHVHHSLIPVEPPINPAGDDQEWHEVVTEVLLAREARFAGLNPDELVADIYLGYLRDRPDSVVAALRAIADTPGAALVHCAAGKDRTGVIVALALTAVGVDPAEVIADYAATGERIDAILARLMASTTYADSVGRIPASEHTPRASAMDRFLSQVEEEHGGVLDWLAAQGFGADDVQRLRDKLLAD